jgi:DNA-binding Lrp family transcriptional regulator
MENELLLDRASRQILEALQADCRLSTQALADKVGLSATPVWRRVKELEDRGIIRRHVALVDREKLGLTICVLANVSLVRHSEGAVEQFERLVAASREIIECHAITGEADYVIKVVVADMKAYDQFLQTQVFRIAGVASVRSNVVLREVKYETALPVSGG